MKMLNFSIGLPLYLLISVIVFGMLLSAQDKKPSHPGIAAALYAFIGLTWPMLVIVAGWIILLMAYMGIFILISSAFLIIQTEIRIACLQRGFNKKLDGMLKNPKQGDKDE
jgi:hypothetical protein